MITEGVSYIDSGEGDPMVLLMGLGADASVWAPHSDVWSRSYRCIAIDNRGAGATPLGEDAASTSNMAADVIRLMDSLELAPALLVAISMGAGIAQELTISRPDLVRKLVLVAPWARVDAFSRSTLEVIRRVHALGDARSFNELLRNTIWSPRWVNENAEAMEAGLDLPLTMGPEAFAQQVSACQNHDALDRLGHVTVPTLVTVGAKDIFIRPELSLEAASRIPGALVHLFDDSGHVHHWEQLDEFNALVEAWVRS